NGTAGAGAGAAEPALAERAFVTANRGVGRGRGHEVYARHPTGWFAARFEGSPDLHCSSVRTRVGERFAVLDSAPLAELDVDPGAAALAGGYRLVIMAQP